jgi:Protein of unknown function (DUF3306)
MSEEGEGFLSRWSRRKRAVVEGRAPEEAAPPVAEAPPALVPEAEVKTEAEDEFDPASLPPVESLTIESDFKAFLHRKVPLDLRAAALRRAWSLDPAIRDFIGPADYAWDFNAPDGVPGFALELGGDAMKLLSHALGLDAPVPKPEAEPQDEAPAMAEAPALEAPPAASSFSIAEAAPEAEASPEAPMERLRRHGSALPV